MIVRNGRYQHLSYPHHWRWSADAVFLFVRFRRCWLKSKQRTVRVIPCITGSCRISWCAVMQYFLSGKAYARVSWLVSNFLSNVELKQRFICQLFTGNSSSFIPAPGVSFVVLRFTSWGLELARMEASAAQMRRARSLPVSTV